MKCASVLFAALVLAGCAGVVPLPDSPSPPVEATPGADAWLVVLVIDSTGACIAGATMDVVRGQGAGRRETHVAPCDVWSPEGGAWFTDLVPDVEMTIRAAAPGYLAQERTVTPSLASFRRGAVEIELSEAP